MTKPTTHDDDDDRRLLGTVTVPGKTQFSTLAVMLTLALGVGAVSAAVVDTVDVAPGDQITVEGELDNETGTATVQYIANESVTLNTSTGSQTITAGSQLLQNTTLSVNASNYETGASTYYPLTETRLNATNSVLGTAENIENDTVALDVEVSSSTAGTLSNVTVEAGPTGGFLPGDRSQETDIKILLGLGALGLVGYLYRRD